MTDRARIRTFSTIARIDYGKSTLADRLIQVTGGRRDAIDWLEGPSDRAPTRRWGGASWAENFACIGAHVPILFPPLFDSRVVALKYP